MKKSGVDRKTNAKQSRAENNADRDRFIPCSQDMTICGDCEGNRAKNECPRLREWLARRGR